MDDTDGSEKEQEQEQVERPRLLTEMTTALEKVKNGPACCPPSAHTISHVSQAKKYKSFRTRTMSTVVLIVSFLGFVYMGHVFLAGLVFTLQVSEVPLYSQISRCCNWLSFFVVADGQGAVRPCARHAEG